MMRSSRPDENAAMFQSLADSQGSLQGPVSLAHDSATPLLLTPLVWKNWRGSGKIKVTNTNCTAVVTGHWKEGRPSVSGGPFSVPYHLGQIHFHWGPSDSTGSEHTLNGHRFPLEMHVILFKSTYERPKRALRERDGIAVLVFFFEIQERGSGYLQTIIDGIREIQNPYRSTYLNPDALKVIYPFTEDYFLYWGSVMTDRCAHVVSWLVCTQPLPVTSTQMAEFRKMLNTEKRHITKNYCDVQPHLGRKIFIAMTDASRDYPGKILMAELAQTFPPNISTRRCCLSARRKRLKPRKQRETVKDIVSSLSTLEEQTSIKLKELEAISKQLVARDFEESEAWFREMERRILGLELRTLMESDQKIITLENFKKLRLKAALFKDVPQPFGQKKNKGAKKVRDDVTYYHKNPQFRSFSRSESMCAVNECIDQNNDMLDSSLNQLQEKTTKSDDEGINMDFSTKSALNEYPHNDDFKEERNQVKFSQHEGETNKSNTRRYSTPQTNFIQRNKSLAGKHKKKSQVEGIPMEKLTGKSAKMRDIRFCNEMAPTNHTRREGNGKQRTVSET